MNKEFVIDRTKWARGKMSTLLLVPTTRRMCCLGFICKQSGLQPQDIRDVATPDHLDKELRDYVPFLLTPTGKDNKLTESAMKINDDEGLSEDEREDRLIKLFKSHNIILKFIN